MLRTLFDSTRSFLKLESASGLVLMAATIAALVIANSPLNAAYASFLATVVGEYSVSIWINDGLMALFFFVVGMEIKHEVMDGALASMERAALPIVGAIGGMVVPALIYLMFVGGTEFSHGWGIPMATDIAFAVGVMALLGSRVPAGAKVFLLALAIADDLGAVLVIALFYTAHIHLTYLAFAAAVLILIWALSRVGVRNVAVHLPLGILTWWLVHHSGVHATIAGCALGFLMPLKASRATLGASRYEPVQQNSAGPSPLEAWVKRLHPFSAFVIMPVFALANAGLSFVGFSWSTVFTDPIVSGVSYGLFFGKPLGIFVSGLIAIKLGFAKLPESVRFPHLFGAAALGGIGFTMSLFVAGLALKDPAALELAKVGIVKGSLLSGIVGASVFLLTSRKSQRVQA